MDSLIKFPNLEMALNEYVKDVYDNYKNSLIEDDRVASGNLINSIETTIVSNGILYTVELRLDETWKFVEYNTKPHWPPVNAILNWVKVKPVLPREQANGKLPTEEQLAFLISRKIANEGTTGTHNLEKTLDALNGFYMKKFEDALAKDLDEEVENILLLITT